MVSSGQQANALLLSSPVILSSSTASHLTPTNNVISSITTQPNLNHPQQSFLQLIQNQQRPPFLYSQQQPQMFLSGQNQLLAQKTNINNSTNLKQTMINNPQQTLLIGSNLQQQILLNKNLIDSQKGKPIMFTHQTANLQPRSQLLPNLQQQTPILSPQFLSSIHHPFAWTNQANLMTHNPIFIRPQQLNNASDGQLFLHTPTNQPLQAPIYLQQNNGTVQLVQSTATTSSINNDESKNVSANLETVDEKTLTKNVDKKQSNTQLSAKPNSSLSSISNDKTTVLKYRKLIGEKMINNQSVKQIHSTKKSNPFNPRNNSRMIIQKSTQQMNELIELDKEKQLLNAKSESIKNNSIELKSSELADFKIFKKEFKTNKKDKLEKKSNVSVVKPCVVLTHKVSGYLIQESNKPFPVKDSKLANDNESNNGTSLKNYVIKETKLKDGKKTRKLKKVLKAKSVNPLSPNNLDDSSANLMDFSSVPIDEQNSLHNDNLINNEQKTYLNKSIYEWTHLDAFEFVLKTTSNLEFATKLKDEKFDGQALSLLSVNTTITIPILTKNFDIRLGPTLLLNKKIDEFKEKFNSEKLTEVLPLSGSNIKNWSVQDVHQFVLNLTSSQEIANEFEKQEIDGYSLTLISVDNLRNDLKINYGPALKIFCKIDELKNRSK